MTAKRASTAAQEIGFYGYKGTEKQNFTVLADEPGITVTGGWVKLAKVQRFQRVSVTVPEGYDPIVLSVPILFDGTIGDQSTNGQKIEKDIKALEWMAGHKEHWTPANEPTAEPPYVEVYSLIGEIQTNLVPTQFQSSSATLPIGTEYYITSIIYDANPLRYRGGDRIRQKAVVELTQIVLSVSAEAAALSTNKNAKTAYYTTNKSVRTIRKIAGTVLHGKTGNGALAKMIAEIHRLNPSLTHDNEKPLPLNKRVLYPQSLTQLVPQ